VADWIIVRDCLFRIKLTTAFVFFVSWLAVGLIVATGVSADCLLKWPADPNTDCGRDTQVPAQGATGVWLAPDFQWAYGGYGQGGHQPCTDVVGCVNAMVTVYLFEGSMNNRAVGRCDLFGGDSPPKSAPFSCFKVCDYGNIFPGDPDTCHTDGMPQLAPLNTTTQYWWRPCPNAQGVTHCEQSWNYNFTTGNGACSFTSSTVSMASGNCDDNGPFQNPLTVGAGVNTICIKPTNTAGQNMALSVDGVVVNSNVASGSETNYFGLTEGTHTVTASWTGNPQFCASSDTGTVTKSECTPNVVTTYFSPNGGTTAYTNNKVNPYPVTLNQSLSLKANATSGNLSTLTLNPPLGNIFSWNNPQNNQWYLVPGMAAATLGTYSVNASDVGAGGYCAASSDADTTTAYFRCNADHPHLSNYSPSNGQTINAPPASYSWQVGDFGMDQCGTNGLTNDSLTVTFYDQPNGSAGGGTAYSQCNYPAGSNPTASAVTSCANTFSYPVSGTHNYSWEIVADNGADSFTSTQNFTLEYLAPAWFRTDSGYVFAQERIGSLIPSTCSVDCLFNTAIGAGSAATVSYNNPTAIDPDINFNGVTNISDPKWFAQSSFSARSPSFDSFMRQLPSVPISFSGNLTWGQVQSNCHDPWADPALDNVCYLLSDGNATLESSNGVFPINNRRVVIFVDGAANVDLREIKVDKGEGFFGLIASGPITIKPGSVDYYGLFFTDSTFITETDDNQLVITGSVIARGGVSLLRDLGEADNKTTPAEIFNYDPSLPFTMPRALKRVQFQVNEVAPTQ